MQLFHDFPHSFTRFIRRQVFSKILIVRHFDHPGQRCRALFRQWFRMCILLDNCKAFCSKVAVDDGACDGPARLPGFFVFGQIGRD
jgi:hypothetical protein